MRWPWDGGYIGTAELCAELPKWSSEKKLLLHYFSVYHIRIVIVLLIFSINLTVYTSRCGWWSFNLHCTSTSSKTCFKKLCRRHSLVSSQVDPIVPSWIDHLMAVRINLAGTRPWRNHNKLAASHRIGKSREIFHACRYRRYLFFQTRVTNIIIVGYIVRKRLYTIALISSNIIINVHQKQIIKFNSNLCWIATQQTEALLKPRVTCPRITSSCRPETLRQQTLKNCSNSWLPTTEHELNHWFYSLESDYWIF